MWPALGCHWSPVTDLNLLGCVIKMHAVPTISVAVYVCINCANCKVAVVSLSLIQPRLCCAHAIRNTAQLAMMMSGCHGKLGGRLGIQLHVIAQPCFLASYII